MPNQGGLTDLRMEDEFRSFQEMEIPHSDYTVRFIQRCMVFIVRCDAQFGILKFRSEMRLDDDEPLLLATSQRRLWNDFSHTVHRRIHRRV